MQRLSAAVDNEANRDERARRAAEMIREARGYRWVGIYDVGDEEISVVGYTGGKLPKHPRSSVSAGLSGDAVRRRATVITGSEAVVPILGAESGVVIGTLDVESDSVDAFTPADANFLEECAGTLRPLYD
ncbi:MAG: GAF domain-containing protein [Candidatus Eremiobacteraeota bacterium]|nr:GAF domain-containing protein [Candidatus Eremiobacteraeota bacterium]